MLFNFEAKIENNNRKKSEIKYNTKKNVRRQGNVHNKCVKLSHQINVISFSELQIKRK